MARELAAKILALPEKRYGVILADPGWRFEPYSRVTGMDRAADNYATSPLEQIKAIDIESIAASDCALFLWATAPMIEAALAVMEAWASPTNRSGYGTRKSPAPVTGIETGRVRRRARKIRA
jgi:N6-adenosine-specific RNA methylase IME4